MTPIPILTLPGSVTGERVVPSAQRGEVSGVCPAIHGPTMRLPEAIAGAARYHTVGFLRDGSSRGALLGRAYRMTS